MIDLVDRNQLESAQELREILAAHRDAKDLINIGAYVRGSNSKVDFAISKENDINAFLRQPLEEGFHLKESCDRLEQLLSLQALSTEVPTPAPAPEGATP